MQHSWAPLICNGFNPLPHRYWVVGDEVELPCNLNRLVHYTTLHKLSHMWWTWQEKEL